jgi:glucose/mannose-6-phosphate isomerase
MIDLDDAGALRAADPSDMLGAVAALPDHVRSAYASGSAATALPDVAGVDAVVCCGMGGSAVAGDIARQAFRDGISVPVEVNRSPLLPAYAGPQTLVVVSSYSGNTSETLSAFRDAVARGCRILAVTAGGELAEACTDREIPVAAVPAGFQPRAALGYLTFAMLGALEAAGLLPSLADDVEETAEVLDALVLANGPDVPLASNIAKGVAAWTAGRVPVIWGAEGIASVAAMRWKTQMNENGKVPAMFASMSELDHNEVVGWTVPYGDGFAVIGLRHEGEHPELAARFPLSAEIAAGAGAGYREVSAAGRSALARLLSLVIVGDFSSCYVALARGVDPTPVEAIARLKDALAGEPMGSSTA